MSDARQRTVLWRLWREDGPVDGDGAIQGCMTAVTADDRRRRDMALHRGQSTDGCSSDAE